MSDAAPNVGKPVAGKENHATAILQIGHKSHFASLLPREVQYTGNIKMSLLDLLSRPQVWETFYDYKTSLACPKDIERQMRGFLDAQRYLPVCDLIQNISILQEFPLPRKSIISKQSTQKKRTVYTYPDAENMVLKLLTFLLLRTYDNLFCDNLYSFRPGKSAKDAIRSLRQIPNLYQKYSYKVDVSNYFNSIPVERLLPELETVLKDDPRLFTFLKTLLTEPYVIDGGKPCHNVSHGRKKAPVTDALMEEADRDEIDMEEALIIKEQKGIMAGTPLASFYANLYLRDMDQFFFDQGIPYARYSDDVIVFGDTMEEVQKHAETIRSFLAAKGLSINPKKEEYRTPEEGFVFLGFSLRERVIDVSPVSVKKIKQKMRRKTRALQRWQHRNDLSGEKAAKAFIRVFHRKLLESSAENDLSWSFWYFPTINTDESLRIIDLYAQECLRTLLTGRHTKARFDARYADLKSLGYQTLVHAYHDFRKNAI